MAPTVVTMPGGRSLTFAPEATRIPFPIEMRIGDAQLLAPAAASCAVEDRMGLAMFPVYTASGTASATGERELVRDGGPARRQLTVAWDDQSIATCNGESVHGHGESRFTFYPDGRIVRLDRFSPNTAGVTNPGPGCYCSGGGGEDLIITTFAAFGVASLHDETPFSVAGDGSEGDTALPVVGADEAGHAAACLHTQTGARVALGFGGLDFSERTHPTRFRRVADEIAMVYDWVPATEHLTSIENQFFSQQTTMLLSSDVDCARLLEQLESKQSAPRIVLGDRRVDVGDDGTYGDLETNRVSVTGPLVVSPSTSTISGGFAVRFVAPGFTAITTDRDPSRVVWQHEPATDSFTVFFLDPLAADSSTTITPVCSL